MRLDDLPSRFQFRLVSVLFSVDWTRGEERRGEERKSKVDEIK